MTDLTKKELSLVLFRSLSAYSMIEALNNLSFHFPQIAGVSDTKMYMAAFIQTLMPSLLLFIAGIVLWIISPAIARYFDKNNYKDDIKSHSYDYEPMIYSALGIFIFVNALAELSKTLVFFYGLESSSMSYELKVGVKNSSVISSLIQIAFGLWLVFGSGKISKFLKSLRRK
ncbi:MAG TPA: hypothetical protein P5294_01830 [Smithellaceae bacterium]|nr:hypothetical protein [Smithellaceae bacterium]HRV25251.1 hypothetical protein [Smithellaceae bacterium]